MYYLVFSALIIGIGIVAMIVSVVQTGTPFRLGVDFLGGTRFEVRFSENASESAIRTVFTEFGINNPAVNSISGEGLENTWQIRTEFVEPEVADALVAALGTEVAPLDPEATLVQTVSPAIGAEVSQAAFIAILVASVVVLLFIMFVFRQVPHPFRYGACALSAMIHDVLVTFGFIAIAGLVLGWEVDSLFLTAVLTVAGFSLQDTIVVFDRIRENLRGRPRESYELIVNRSILETIHRSLATQLSAMFILVALLLFGGASIRSFIAVLLVGMVSGTYSSIFHAVPLLVTWEKRIGAHA